MAKLNLKAIRITSWICVGFCVLALGYALYSIIFRDYIFRDYILAIAKTGICVYAIVIGLILIFLSRIIRGVNNNQVFIHDNHRLLIYSAVGLFCLSYIKEFSRMYVCHLKGMETDWMHLVLNPIMKPDHITYVISGLLLMIIAYLYKIGVQVAEEQSLTI